MNKNDSGNNQTGKSQAVSDSLDQHARRAQRRRGDVRSAIIVNNGSDRNVKRCDGSLTNSKRLVIVLRVAHFRNNVEEARRARIGKDESANGG